jgi:hypothetical protein
MMKRLAILAAGLTAVTGMALGAGVANASTGTEYTNAGINPVAGYLAQYTAAGHGFNGATSYIGSANTDALSQLPAGAGNGGVGIELCDPATGYALQAGVVNNGNAPANEDTYNVEVAEGDLGPAPTSQNDPCLNGVLPSADVFATLLTDVPVNDTVSVRISHLHGDVWQAEANVVVNGEYSFFQGGTGAVTRNFTAGYQGFTEAGFGTQANKGQALEPLSQGGSVLGSMAHMRAIYGSVVHGHQTGAPTLDRFPSNYGNVDEVISTGNGDPGGVQYIVPTGLVQDGFALHEGTLISQ